MMTRLVAAELELPRLSEPLPREATARMPALIVVVPE